MGFQQAVHMNRTNSPDFKILFDKQQWNNTYDTHFVLKLSTSRLPKTQKFSLKPLKTKVFVISIWLTITKLSDVHNFGSKSDQAEHAGLA